MRTSAAQHQHRTGDGVPHRPQVDILHRAVLEGIADRRVVVQGVGSVLLTGGGVQRQVGPAEFIRNPEIGVDRAEIVGSILKPRKPRAAPDPGSDAVEGGAGYERSHVVQDQPPDRGVVMVATRPTLRHGRPTPWQGMGRGTGREG